MHTLKYARELRRLGIVMYMCSVVSSFAKFTSVMINADKRVQTAFAIGEMVVILLTGLVNAANWFRVMYTKSNLGDEIVFGASGFISTSASIIIAALTTEGSLFPANVSGPFCFISFIVTLTMFVSVVSIIVASLCCTNINNDTDDHTVGGDAVNV